MQSLLDNDLYKFSMQQAVWKLYPAAQVQYRFVNRGNTEFPQGFAQQLRTLVYNMSLIKLSPFEYDYLKSLPYFSETYLEFLKNFTLDQSNVDIIQPNKNLLIVINGPWYQTILWEVPLMAAISELYFNMTGQRITTKEKADYEKADALCDHRIKYADFGTRRRFSFENHKRVVNIFKNYENFLGTSNVLLAMQNDIKPIGTMAHEWYSFHAAKYGYKLANKIALDKWVEIYNGQLGIALPDTFTTDVFLRTFDSYYARLFDGVRQDSGDPIEFGNKMIKHYNELGINPKEKTIVFSDNLNVDKCIEINEQFKDKVKVVFGIGTNLTNDVGVKPLNMVIKLFYCANKGGGDFCIKLSDTPGKHTGDEEEINLCKKTLKIA
jgi:nicotinate phosphoribosyltransferase